MTLDWTGRKIDDVAMTVDAYASRDMLAGAGGSKEHVDRRLHAFSWSCRAASREEAKSRAMVAAKAALQTLRAVATPKSGGREATRTDGSEPMIDTLKVIHGDNVGNDHVMELRRALVEAFGLGKTLDQPLHDFSQEDAVVIGDAALRHAASRAKLPNAEADIKMFFADVDRMGLSPQRQVDVELVVDCYSLSVIRDLQPTPGLIAIQTALGVLQVTSGRHCRNADLGVAMIEVPASATMRAAMTADLQRRRDEDARTLRAFMARFGLNGELP